MAALQETKTGELTLFAILLGCKPKGRNVEQHDVMFAVAGSLNDLTDNIKTFWYRELVNDVTRKIKKLLPAIDASAFAEELGTTFNRRDRIHIDAWMPVKYVDGYKVRIHRRDEAIPRSDLKLFFINLGGYKENEFEEFHKKMFVVASAPSLAIDKVMSHNFMNEYSPDSLGRAGKAHLDDHYKIDFEADDIICVSDNIGEDYTIELVPEDNLPVNEMSVGYVKLTYF